MRTGNRGFQLAGAGPTRLGILILIAVFGCPRVMLGQRGGTGHNRRPLICVHDCTTSADEARPEDELKGFNQVMALQGTPEQSAALVNVVHELQLVKDQLQTLQPSGSGPAPQKVSATVAVMDQSIAKLTTETQGFLGSFSPAQKTGLRDISKKMEDADSELSRQLAALDQVSKDPKTTSQQVTDSAAGVTKTLGTVEEDQLALAREMGIIVPSSELVFHFEGTNSANIGETAMSIPVSADLSRTSSVNCKNVFAEKFVADLSDLQDNITAILRSQLPRSPACGERPEIRDAMFIAEPSRIFARVYIERWICPSGSRFGATEVASGEGSVELKVTPIAEKDGKLGLDCQIGHADGNDFARDALLGNVGHELQDTITTALGIAIQKAADSQLLPTSAGWSPAIDKAQFRQTIGHLSLVLDGRLELSDQQIQDFANQVKQQLSAQQRSTP